MKKLKPFFHYESINKSKNIIMQTTNIWQLSWGKNYDYIGRMEAAAASENGRNMMQSWGRKPLTHIGKIKVGDILYITCNGKCIMQARVTKEFYNRHEFEKDTFTLDDEERDERHKNKWYCNIYITEIYLGKHQKNLRGNQNTFCNPTNAFWKN